MKIQQQQQQNDILLKYLSFFNRWTSEFVSQIA